jgi:hypothetical protein
MTKSRAPAGENDYPENCLVKADEGDAFSAHGKGHHSNVCHLVALIMSQIKVNKRGEHFTVLGEDYHPCVRHLRAQVDGNDTLAVHGEGNDPHVRHVTTSEGDISNAFAVLGEDNEPRVRHAAIAQVY